MLTREYIHCCNCGRSTYLCKDYSYSFERGKDPEETEEEILECYPDWRKIDGYIYCPDCWGYAEDGEPLPIDELQEEEVEE